MMRLDLPVMCLDRTSSAEAVQEAWAGGSSLACDKILECDC